MLKVHSVETFGTHDGPGIRLVVFTQGCMFRCAYCHNPDSQLWDNPNAINLTTKEILEKLEKQKPYFKNKGGLTFSGGEPTLQAKELVKICKKVKKADFHITLDTCGAIHNKETQQLYDLCDLVMLDVKHINQDWHKKLTNQPNDTVLKNAQYREKTKKDMWLRYVLVPGWTDQEEYLDEWAQYFSKFESIKKVQILPYHHLGIYKYDELGLDYKLEGVPAANEADALRAQKIFKKYLKNVEIA